MYERVVCQMWYCLYSEAIDRFQLPLVYICIYIYICRPVIVVSESVSTMTMSITHCSFSSFSTLSSSEPCSTPAKRRKKLSRVLSIANGSIGAVAQYTQVEPGPNIVQLREPGQIPQGEQEHLRNGKVNECVCVSSCFRLTPLVTGRILIMFVTL